MGVHRGNKRGPPWLFSKSLGKSIRFPFLRKIKIIKITDHRNKKKRKREDFNYVSKRILKLIIRNKNF